MPARINPQERPAAALWGRSDVAARLNVSGSTVDRLAALGKIDPPIQLVPGGQKFWLRDRIESYIASLRREGATQ